jgi:transcriptional regulator with XRE-family HTH domain
MSNDPSTNWEDSFARRLQHRLQLKGKKDSPTALAREFNLRWRGVPITTNAVRKWLKGESTPTMDKMEVLANMLGVTPDWLRWGDRENTTGSSAALTNQTQRFIKSLTIENMETAVLQDYRLLNPQNRELIFSMMELLLMQQDTHR